MKNKNITATVSIKEIKEVSIVARRWFQSSYGNTYHSMELSALVSRQTANRIDPEQFPLTEKNYDVYIDLARVPFEYGYGDHYLHTAMQALIASLTDCPEDFTTDKHYHIDRALDALGIPCFAVCHDVKRKKDL